MRPAVAVVLLIAALASACGDSSSPATVTVNGRVLDAFGIPIPDAVVLINGKKSLVADGAFSAAGVTTPYDATLIRSHLAVSYQGLTRSDPTLQYPDWVAPMDRSTGISGSISGG